MSSQKNNTTILLCLFIISFLFSHIVVKGQESKEDVVYLKNGSIIRGNIIEYKKDTLVKIETRDRSVWAYSDKEVLKMTKENIREPYFMAKTKGYYNVTQVGFIFNNASTNSTSSNNNATQFCINTSNGYQFNRFLHAGAFVSLNVFDNFLIVPTGLELRGVILPTRISPYYLLQVGRGWCLKTDNTKMIADMSFKPGWMVHPAVGLKFSGRNCAFITEFGFEYQDFSERIDQYGYITDQFYIYRRISFKLGLMF